MFLKSGVVVTSSGDDCEHCEDSWAIEPPLFDNSIQSFVLKVEIWNDKDLNVSRAITRVIMHVCLRVYTYVRVRMLCLCFAYLCVARVAA